MALACYGGVGQSIGPKNGTNFRISPLPGSESGWVDIERAESSDDVVARIDDLPDDVGSYTDYLVVSGFRFDISSDYRIAGIAVTVETIDQIGNVADYSVRLVKQGKVTGADRSQGQMFFNENIRDEMHSFGGPNDVWGEVWSVDDINSNDFGVAFSAKRAAPGSSIKAGIDNITVTIFVTKTFVTLPLRLISFNATPKGNNVNVKWSTMEESSMDHFTVERSANGTTFTALGDVSCANRQQFESYTFNDEDAISGTSWYRLKIVGSNGSISYSKIVTVYFTRLVSHYLFPSPWKNGSTLFIKNPSGEKLTVCFYSSTGELINKSTTTSQQVNTNGLKNTSGNIHYKILNAQDAETGTGKLVVY